MSLARRPVEAPHPVDAFIEASGGRPLTKKPDLSGQRATESEIAERLANMRQDRWKGLADVPPFIRTMYENRAEKAEHTRFTEIDDLVDALEAAILELETKVLDSDGDEAEEEVAPVASLSQRLRKEKPVAVLKESPRALQTKLKDTKTFLRRGLVGQAAFPGRKSLLILCGNMALEEIMGEDWYKKYKPQF